MSTKFLWLSGAKITPHQIRANSPGMAITGEMNIEEGDIGSNP